MMHQYQRGATMWTTLSVGLMVGFLIYLSFVVGGIFLDHKFITGSMQEVVNRADFKSMTRKSVIKTINSRLLIDGIRNLEKNAISIKREKSGEKYLMVDYAAKANVLANISVVVDFKEEIRSSK